MSRVVITRPPTHETTAVANAPGPKQRALIALAVLVTAALAGIIASGSGFGSSAAIVTLGLAGGAALALLAVNRFWWMLVALFVIRASLDNYKAGSGVQPTTLIGAVFLASAVVWLFVQWRVGALVPFSWSAKALLAFSGAFLISAVGASDQSTSFQGASKVLSMALMLVVLEQIFAANPERFPVFLGAIFASLIIPLVVSYLVQLPGLKPQTGFNQIDVGRLNGTFAHAASFCAYLIVLVLIAFALLPYMRGWWRAALVTVVVGTLPLILFTYSRAGWLALLGGLVFIGIAQSRAVIVGLLVMIIVVMIAIPSVSTRLADLTGTGSKPATVTKVEPNSLTWRILYWQKVFPLLGQNPTTGIGPDMVQQSLPEAAPPHNSFLQALVEGGVLGFVLFMWAVAALWRALVAGGRRLTAGLPRGVAVAAAAAALSIFIQLFSENILTSAAIPWYLLVPVAWVIAESRRRQLEAETHPAPLVAAFVPRSQ